MKHSRKIAIVAVVALVLLVRAGLSYAWFSQRAALSTLMDIIPPDSIEIYPVDADGGEMGMLDLDFKEGIDDKQTDGDGNVTITIRRPICIESTSPVHQLEVVHTTNLNELSFNIYPATKNADGSFTYDTNSKLSGEYRNPRTGSPALAEKEEAEKNNFHNYKGTDIVEDHAYPLYWLAVESGCKTFVANGSWNGSWAEVESNSDTRFDPAKQVDKTYYSTYYYLEISWQENSKETDLFYIMAQNIAVKEKPDGAEGGGNA